MKKISFFVMTLTATFVFATTVFSFGLIGDFDNDGDVDGDDLAVFSENFGKTDGTCKENESCISDYYCAKNSGDCSGNGTCAPKPAVCIDIWAPVCGCDAETYANVCYANRSGVNIAYEGECKSDQCDDGSDPVCDMIPPKCSEFEILSIQNGCWICVNPATCKPWGEPGCSDVTDCPVGMMCDFCGTSSCPYCDDCVPACVAKPI